MDIEKPQWNNSKKKKKTEKNKCEFEKSFLIGHRHTETHFVLSINSSKKKKVKKRNTLWFRKWNKINGEKFEI